MTVYAEIIELKPGEMMAQAEACGCLTGDDCPECDCEPGCSCGGCPCCK